ncbi:hypothetical protein H5410_019882 [Solanum commersonii]|uniref:WW domain-containing protein n=1 Tax=Solanum commersonii TaxID=4109 RepID=A0A9J5Z6V3_SOLCO|nr:hypothetical protein H5410_019882 [Solanum commersonii]
MVLCPNSSAKSPDPSHFVSSLAQRAASLHAISPSIQPIAQFLALSVEMASPAWLPQETQSSSSQTSVMSSATGEPTTSSSTPNADSTQEAAQGKFISPPGYSVCRASFSYMNANVPSGSSQQSSSSPVIPSTSAGSSALLQPPIPGQSANVGSSFSYNISQTDQFSSSTLRPAAPDHSVDVKNASPAASLQPPLPLVSTRLSSFMPGTATAAGPLISGSNLSFNGGPQMMQTDQTMKPNRRVDVAQETGGMTSATFVMHSVSQAVHMSSGSSTAAFPTSHMGSPNIIRMPHAPQFQVPAGVPRSSVTPGLGLAIPSSSNLTATASPGGPSLPLRPNASPVHVLANPSVQQQTYSPYFSPTPIAPSHQGPWLQPPPVTTMLRPPFPSYPAGFAVPFPLSATGAPLSSVTLPDTRPPGVAPVAAPPGVPTTASQSTHASGLQPELPPGVDSCKHVNDADTKQGASTSEQLETWTAHRTETGAIYYYNSLTGESTYEKPAGFRGEPGKVAAQPTPVSWERLAGTDWALVATNDGQKYYYNTKTKLSSWQIPSEVTELKKKHDADALQAQSPSILNVNESTEKGSAPISLSIPAVSTGGRDATSLRPSLVPGSSALDLVKRS